MQMVDSEAAQLQKPPSAVISCRTTAHRSCLAGRRRCGPGGQGRLTFPEVRVLLPRASFSARLSAPRVRRFTEQLGLEMKYSDFIPLLYPGETLPSDG